MRTSRALMTIAAAAAAFAQPRATAGAQQLSQTRVAVGAPPQPGAALPDAGFQYAYSFRAGGFAPGGDGANALLGAGGSCRVGEGCQTSAARGHAAGASSYFIGLTFGGEFSGSPSLFVAGPPGEGEVESTELALAGYTPSGPVNAFYLFITPPAGATMTVGDLILFGAPPGGSVGFGAAAGGGVYALYRADSDLRDAILAFDVMFGDAPAGAPTVDIYVGALPAVSTVPEPNAVVLTAAGLAALIGVVRRQRARVA